MVPPRTWGRTSVPVKGSAIRLACLLGPEIERRVLAAHQRRSDHNGIDDRHRVQMVGDALHARL
jgi:hypothetical protein